jgi:Fe2+ or Zn2+ uptake regulation protein
LSGKKNFIEELRRKGYKVTPQRKAILSILDEGEHQLLTAQELFEGVKKEVPRTNFSTVYRNLEILLEEGIVRKVELGRDAAYYELRDDKKHHHHLICKGCGNIGTTDFCPLDQIIGEDGFIPVEHRFEIYGYCRECALAKKAEGKLP